MANRDWVKVDLDGLEKTLSRRGKSIILGELVRNAWDEDGVTVVTVDTLKLAGTPKAQIRVIDNAPQGFQNLDQTFTMFAESYKKGDPLKAGRFNVGDKLVLAFCEEATIVSTTGGVEFTAEGRKRLRRSRKFGTDVDVLVRMNREEYDELLAYAKRLIVPNGIRYLLNGEPVLQPTLVAELPGKLTTEISDASGVLKRVLRDTDVRVYEPLPGDTPALYELGIPVMELDGKYHVDVQQKVPLTLERDAVPPSFLRQVNTLLVNELFEKLTPEDAAADWVRTATGSKDIRVDAFEQVMKLRFGDKRVAYDLSDSEANKIAVSEGYTVVHGGSLSKEEWKVARAEGIIRPAGQVTPSPKAFHPGGKPLKVIPPDNWTHDMNRLAVFATKLAERLLNGKLITVTMVNDPAWGHAGAYGPKGILYINLPRVGGHTWYKSGPSVEQMEFLFHEFAHETVSDHLSRQFADEVARLGASTVLLVMENYDLFERWGE